MIQEKGKRTGVHLDELEVMSSEEGRTLLIYETFVLSFIAKPLEEIMRYFAFFCKKSVSRVYDT